MGEQKLAHHRERVKHYEDEFNRAENDLKMNGVSFVPNLASVSEDISSYLPSSSMQPKMDQDKVDKVNECRGKLREHRDAVCGYQMYLNAFRVAFVLNMEEIIELRAEDVQYFGIE